MPSFCSKKYLIQILVNKILKCFIVFCHTLKNTLMKLIETAHIAVMLQIGDLNLSCKLVSLYHLYVIHIRAFFIVCKQIDRINNIIGEAALFELLESYRRVLDNIMKKRCADGIFIVHLLRKMKRMKDVRQTALIDLKLMSSKHDFHRFFS